MGGLFLLYLSYNTFSSWQKYDEAEKIDRPSKVKTLFNAVVVNLLNPNPYLGWSLIMGPLFLEGWNIEKIYGVMLIASFYITLVFFIALTIIIFAFARRFGPKFSKILLGLSSLALLGFGIYQLIIGVAYFI